MIRLPRSGSRKFTSILLVIFGLAVLAPFFHHHDEDGQAHETCLLCFYIAHHSDIVFQEERLLPLLDCHLLVSREILIDLLSTFNLPFLIRAPPV